MRISTKKQSDGSVLASAKVKRGEAVTTSYLNSRSVFIRACDGALLVSANQTAGPLREALTAEERAMAEKMPVVKALRATEKASSESDG